MRTWLNVGGGDTRPVDWTPLANSDPLPSGSSTRWLRAAGSRLAVQGLMQDNLQFARWFNDHEKTTLDGRQLRRRDRSASAIRLAAMTAVPRPSAKAFVAMVLATAFITTTAAGCGRTGSGRAPAAQESIAGCDLPSALAGSPVIFQLQIVQALYESMTPDQRRTAGMDAITADGKIAETLDFARWYNDHEAPLTLQGRELRDWETDLLRYFKTPSAAYAAYCGGWRFKDYLATHPGPLPGSSTPISP